MEMEAATLILVDTFIANNTTDMMKILSTLIPFFILGITSCNELPSPFAQEVILHVVDAQAEPMEDVKVSFMGSRAEYEDLIEREQERGYSDSGFRLTGASGHASFYPLVEGLPAEKGDSIFFYVRSHYDPVTTYYDTVDNQNGTHFLVINRKRLKVYDVEVVLER